MTENENGTMENEKLLCKKETVTATGKTALAQKSIYHN